MNPQFLRLPEPSGPESELLRSAAELPQLSPELRKRVMAACHRQLVTGRLIRAGQRTVLAAVLLAGLIAGWRYWQRPVEPVAAPPASAQSPVQQGFTSEYRPGEQSSPLPPATPQLRQSPGVPGNIRLRP
jgi:hypothetical protein